jgi:predicted RNase H-like HicB family nuclease
VTDNNRYPAEVFWSEEDGGFIAIAPDLPGCSAFGETQPEALAELQDAMAAWIEAARAAGNPIPEASDPAREADYSGKVLLRMPRDLHARLARLAKIDAVSLNHYIIYLLTSASTHRSIEISMSRAFHGLASPQLPRGSTVTDAAACVRYQGEFYGAGGQSSNLYLIAHRQAHTTTKDLTVFWSGTGAVSEHKAVGTDMTWRQEAKHG